MTLDEAFERVYVINLPFKVARREKLEQNLKTTGIVDPKKVFWERGVYGDWAPAPSWWGAGNGAWGCLMSHVRIAQDAAQDAVASYCVLEDDVVFHHRAQEMLDEFMTEVPDDWGQIYLGGQFLHQKPEPVSPWVVRPYNVNRTHAFALRKPAIPRFLQHVMHAPDYLNICDTSEECLSYTPNNYHIDHQLGRAHERRDWNVYAPTWWLAGQDEGPSSISGKTNVAMWWHWRSRGHCLPYLYLTSEHDVFARELAERHLHCGYNLFDNSFIDIGLTRNLSDLELESWLQMIAGEAIERWRIPAFEVPAKYPELIKRIESIWKHGVFILSKEKLAEVLDYPFNGLCGGVKLKCENSKSPD